MRRIIYASVLFSSALFLSSCYNTRIAVGDVSPTHPMVEVNSHRNDFLLWGLVPLNNASKQASEFIGDRENYVIRTNQSFINGLLSSITFGIYTPTTTTYYLPVEDYKLGTNVRGDYNNTRSSRQNTYEEAPQSQRRFEYTPPADRIPSNSPEQEYTPEPRRSSRVQSRSYEAPIREYEAIVLYKNGAEIDATVVGEASNGRVKLRLDDGRIVESRMSDIEKISKK
ncbi:MAG TPA: hypothetical protein DIT04_13335 [Dysgonomonas sp.]|nr:hypothetical protein [Dysgonomonas sp.]